MDKQVPKSWITGGETDWIFDAEILGKHVVSYYRCKETGFIQTEPPYWLTEAYESAIASIDLGYVSRNIETADLVSKLIHGWDFEFRQGLDYGGGYGMFTRRMRDLGHDFIHHDLHCQNLFALHFELDPNSSSRFDLLTAFEVFEHLVEPKVEIEKMFDLSDTLVFSTLLASEDSYASAEDWWYFVPETGQHVSLFTQKSLENLAGQFKARFFTNGQNLHIMTRDVDLSDPFPGLDYTPGIVSRILSKLKRITTGKASGADEPNPSLLQSDFEKVLGLVRKAR